MQIPQYNPGSCLQTLLRRPLLAEPEARLELLSFIDNQISTSGYADAVRYLLHAQSEDNFASLLVNGSARRPVWTKIIEQIVPKWRVIPEQMANKLARDPHWRILNISEIDVTNVIRHIQEVGPRQIDCSTFNDDDRDTLLREIQDSNDILKGLHIHRSIDDNFVAVVDGKTFLDSDLRSCLDNSLLTQLVLIQPIRQDPQTLLATKQRQLIPPLDAKTIIELVFKQSRPENHWRVIMAVLLSDVRKDQTLDKDLRNKLRKAKWLPTDNHFVAPEDVLYIPGLEDEIARLVSTLPGVFVEIQMLHKDISDNNDVKRLLARNYFPSRAEALVMLGQMMANDPKYHVGILETSDLAEDKLQNFVEVFDPTVMPACQVLKTILDKVPLDDCLGLFRELIREISVERIIAVLNYLAEQHQNTPQHKNKFMAIHSWYLASISQSSDFHNSVLPKIKLLNQRAEWKSTEQLCFEKHGQGIDIGDILNKKQEKIIRKAYPDKLDEEVEIIEVQGSLPPQISGGNLDKHLSASVDLLKEYFRGWSGLVADQLIGGFLCLLGDHESLKQLAETYLYPRTVAGTREMLEWEPNTGTVLVGQSQNIHEIMEQTRYIVTVEDVGLTLKVQSIAGPYFDARRKPESEFQYLFAGAIVSFSEKPLVGLPLAFKVRQLRLIRIHSDARRSELLQNSAREIFKICLRDALPDQSRLPDQSPERVLRVLILQRLGKFDQSWEELAHKEQLDILIAQDLLLEAAFFYLKQLGVPSDSMIGQILKRLDDLRFRQTEEKQASKSSTRVKGHVEESSLELQREMQTARTELQTLLEQDQDTQALLLKSVRDKVKDNRYGTWSIPFELFQNADDAVAELYEMTESLEPYATNFVVRWDGQKICFIHWGRPINKFRDVGFDDGRRRGYHRDLEKMLVMSYSDKILEADGVPVTGKFGLGFKSTFLISECPKIVSGQLGFEVIGGMYPKRLLPDEIERLHDYVEDNLQRHKATIIELPVVKEIAVEQGVLQDFTDLIHLMLVFAHRIKRCYLNSLNPVSWQEQNLLDIKNVYIGELQSVNKSEATKALVFRTEKLTTAQKPQMGALLLELGPRGFRSLDKNVPTIWATAPTQERLEVGFVVNGSFDLDVGRARLDTANIEDNFNLARVIGDEFGKSLRQLFDISSGDWSKLCEALLLAKDAREYDFWYSLWRLLADDFSNKLGSNDILRLLQDMLWGDSTQPRAMTKLIMEHCALPTGLWGDFQVLTQLRNVKYVTEGVLDSRDIFNTVSSWILDNDQKAPGELISERTAKVIIKLLQSESSEDEKRTKSVREQLTQITKALYRDEADHLSIQSLRLHQVIDGRIARLKGDIDRGSAEQFGTLITPPFMKQHDLEAGEIRVHLKGTRFLNQEGNYYPVTELLIAVDSFESSNEQEDEQAVHELKEEQSIASFAPNGRILANEYKGDALAFFKICRQKRSTSSKELVNWAFNTKEDSKQVNLLRYLLGKRDLAEEIRTDLRFKESWLAQLNENSSILVRNFDEGEISELLVLLRLRLINRDANQELRPSPPQRVNVNPKELLAKIYYWWVDQGNKQRLIPWYENKIYHNLPPKLHFADENVLKNNLEARRHWLVLFLLGSSHTMGWFDPMSPDRNFLALCRDKGWLDTFANPGSTAKDWIGVLDKYLDEKIESDISYQHWMRQFVGIYQLARELPEYVGAFSRIGEVRDSFSLDAFTRLKQSPLFSRGGYSASRIDRTLGAGACFVVRELVRKELITSPHAYEHCYTPVNAVRDRFFELGCDDLEDDTKVNNSKIMFRFLREHMDQKKVTFDHSFDLPFLFITKGWGSIDEFARNF